MADNISHTIPHNLSHIIPYSIHDNISTVNDSLESITEYSISSYLNNFMSLYVHMIHIIMIAQLVSQGISLLMLPDNAIPKPRLLHYVLDVFAISVTNGLLWPLFMYSFFVRSIATAKEYDFRYITAILVINPEIYRGYYGFLRKHLFIYPNLYSRHLFHQAENKQPLTAGCFTLSLYKYKVQIIVKMIDWDC